MKTIKLSSGRELPVLDITFHVTLIRTEPASVAEAEALIAELTDEELTRVELLAGDTVIDSANNLTFHQMDVEMTIDRCVATYILLPKSDIPAEITDKAMAYDILMGGETNG